MFSLGMLFCVNFENLLTYFKVDFCNVHNKMFKCKHFGNRVNRVFEKPELKPEFDFWRTDPRSGIFCKQCWTSIILYFSGCRCFSPSMLICQESCQEIIEFQAKIVLRFFLKKFQKKMAACRIEAFIRMKKNYFKFQAWIEFKRQEDQMKSILFSP